MKRKKTVLFKSKRTHNLETLKRIHRKWGTLSQSPPTRNPALMSINTNPPPRFRISSPHNSSITIPLSPSITPAPIFPRTLQELQQSGLWGVSPLHQHQPKEVTITWRFWNVTNITTTNKNNDYNVVFINNVYNKASAMHTHGWFFFVPPPPPPPLPPVAFVQRYHYKRVWQHIHVSFSQEVIHLSLNFSCGLLLIGPLILPSHPFSQMVHNFR